MLVSIVVVTYNSQEYVLDAINSVREQTYPNIELIITDDCSTDDTVAICTEWIDENKDRFENVCLITSDHNTGITANRNRGNFVAKGEWIKHVDGDDKLLPSCIADYIEYVKNNPHINIVFSPLHLFGEGDLEKWSKLLHTNFEFTFGLCPRDFKILLCKTCLFPAPSLFVNADFFKSLGGYDETIRDLEDWPFWVKAAFCGANFAYIETPEVNYRISSSSLSQGIGGANSRYKEAIRLIEKNNLFYMSI